MGPYFSWMDFSHAIGHIVNIVNVYASLKISELNSIWSMFKFPVLVPDEIMR